MFFVPKALSTINSEEDAEMALQLSSSLTQALLAYRIKTVPTASPLNEVLNAVKGVSFPGPSNNNP
ncbi:hypothetical protein GBAR_LOCUS20868 [Geodia barretti]|uniref:Uncharacterized protein n=1 Tax=Geodia barretti TaxID=519541 RepID=A0AA35SXE0_GEOBA|nr:hypothetical protein GBAR_LOCUS20868 [Geodia barretti]